MVADFATLANTLTNGTRDKLIEKDIRENAVAIANQIEHNGFYVNDDLGFEVSTSPANDQGK